MQIERQHPLLAYSGRVGSVYLRSAGGLGHVILDVASFVSVLLPPTCLAAPQPFGAPAGGFRRTRATGAQGMSGTPFAERRPDADPGTWFSEPRGPPLRSTEITFVSALRPPLPKSVLEPTSPITPRSLPRPNPHAIYHFPRRGIRESIQGMRDQAVATRNRRGPPGPGLGRSAFPLTSMSGAPDTPAQSGEARD